MTKENTYNIIGIDKNKKVHIKKESHKVPMVQKGSTSFRSLKYCVWEDTFYIKLIAHEISDKDKAITKRTITIPRAFGRVEFFNIDA